MLEACSQVGVAERFGIAFIDQSLPKIGLSLQGQFFLLISKEMKYWTFSRWQSCRLLLL